MLKELTSDLRDQRNRRAQHHRQFAGVGQLLGDPQRDACLSGAARQNYATARLASRDVLLIGLLARAQAFYSRLDRLSLHT